MILKMPAPFSDSRVHPHHGAGTIVRCNLAPEPRSTNLGTLNPLSTNPDPKSNIPESGKGRGESLKALKEVVIDFRDPVGAFDLNAYLMLDHEFRELLAVD